jgi:hypothetical protein
LTGKKRQNHQCLCGENIFILARKRVFWEAAGVRSGVVTTVSAIVYIGKTGFRKFAFWYKNAARRGKCRMPDARCWMKDASAFGKTPARRGAPLIKKYFNAEGARNAKFQTPTSKFQRSSNFQIPN